MSKKAVGRVVTIVPATLVFGDPLKAKVQPAAPGQAPKPPRFEVTCVIPKENQSETQKEGFNELKAALEYVAKEAFGRGLEFVKHGSVLRDGDEENRLRVGNGKKPYEAYKGAWVIKGFTYENSPPDTAKREEDGSFGRHPTPADFYSGCQVLLTLNIKPFDSSGNQGITSYLEVVIKWADGDRLGAPRTTAADVYARYAAKQAPANPNW